MKTVWNRIFVVALVVSLVAVLSACGSGNASSNQGNATGTNEGSSNTGNAGNTSGTNAGNTGNSNTGAANGSNSGNAAGTTDQDAGGDAGATLKIGTDTTFKPFAFTNPETGKSEGFDIDLFDAVAKEAGLTYELEPMDFDAIINSIASGTLDGGIAGITIKPDRAEKVDFSIPYYNAGLSLLVAADNDAIKSEDDLAGKVIATKTATTSYDYVKDNVEGYKELKPYSDISQAFQELLNGRADAVLFDGPTVAAFANDQGKGKVKIVQEIQTGEQYGFAFTKGSDVVDKVNAAIKKLADDGTYATIYKKWLGTDPTVLPGQDAQ